MERPDNVLNKDKKKRHNEDDLTVNFVANATQLQLPRKEDGRKKPADERARTLHHIALKREQLTTWQNVWKQLQQAEEGRKDDNKDKPEGVTINRKIPVNFVLLAQNQSGRPVPSGRTSPGLDEDDSGDEDSDAMPDFFMNLRIN